MIKIAVLVSGSGTNLQSLIDNCSSGFIPGEIVLVISSKPGVFALARAKKANIESLIIEKKNFHTENEFDRYMLEEIKVRKIDLVCLAGYLHKIGTDIIEEYKNRIMNIHPALLPKYGGKGMYGHHVHEAVLKSGDKDTGCTVHFVDEVYDHGAVILQEKVPVKEGDTPQILAERVLEVEHKLFPEAVRRFALGELET
ncbi:phosphoribosylglycinamide formyltransferase [Elusimicrobiota bacterium]